MTRITVRLLVWDEINTEHIKKHNVSVEEVEEIGKYQIAHKKGYGGRYIVIGRSGTRIIAAIIRRLNTGIYRVITARDADKDERRRVYEKEKQKTTRF